MDAQLLETVQAVGLSLLVGCVLAVSIAAWRVGSAWLRGQEDSQLAMWAAALVAQAELSMRGAEGAKKLEWVLGELSRLYPGIDAAIVRPLVEAAVLRLTKDKPG